MATRTEVRMKFARAAKECSAKVRHLPKGARRRAFLECMSKTLRGY